MSRITAYQFSLSADSLPAATQGHIPEALVEPLQALVATVSRRVAEKPLSIYVCADEDGARSRDHLAFALAKTLTAHVPSTLLVDCDFVRAGLHGVVPQKDALGLLDFLLYGSSIGVITQESHGGVHIVGAGSFPVTKRMPFVESAFEDAARRLVAHARCVLFVGPLFDETGAVHALARAVDVTAVVRTSTREARLDTAEETISGGRAEVWSLRFGAAAPAREPAPRPAAPAPRPAPRPSPRPRPAPPPAPPEVRTSSLAPRLAIVIFGLVVIAFVAWWLLQNRSTTTESPSSATPAGSPPVVPAPPVDSATAAVHDSTAPATTPFGAADTTALLFQTPLNPAADTGGRSGGTVLLNPADIHVMDDVVRNYRGWFLIHISSFQGSIRAREEVAFFQSREFPVFIVFLDLGPKGKWYRVYSGPFETRAEAEDVKKNLDAIPQVRFTRIATIPE
jgi:cell division septation protein DedD